MERKIIGGVRGTDVSAPSTLGKKLLDSKHGLYANARSAFFTVASLLELKRIWLPSFLCDTILIPFELLGIDCQFYAVDASLQPDLEDCALAEGDAVCVISYFGFSHKDAIYEQLSSCGVIIIEDLCQAFYQEPHPLADFSVKSLRKFFAVPDGAIVYAKGDRQVVWPYELDQRSDLAWGIEAIAARTLYDLGLSDSTSWYEYFQKSEAAMPVGCVPMSEYTKTQLAWFIDFDNESSKRISNYDYLLANLSDIALIENRKGAVPLGFPVVIGNRDEVRKRLYAQKIYPPVHWDIMGVVPPNHSGSHRLSHDIMTLPCDGRYGEEDMERMITVLKSLI